MQRETQQFSHYQEVLDYLYTQLPMFQRIGAGAYKKDLVNTHALCEFLGHPEHQFKSIHVAGTNGKGSSSHFLAAILQSAGYKTGLYTSPHLKNFTERIKINGREMPAELVVEFVNRMKPCIEKIQPSFFELTVGMAFDYFAREKVDIAVIEVGMGGRLDSTNVILPEVSLITNISKDHQQWLGNTLEEVAGEKAGIIKQHIPVVISERQPHITHVFEQKASSNQADLYFAQDHYTATLDISGRLQVTGARKMGFAMQSAASYQAHNVPGVLKVLDILQSRGFNITDESIIKGIEGVNDITGLKGRWQMLNEKPLTICDVGHNQAGIEFVLNQIAATPYDQLHMIWGSVNDKDISGILRILPEDAHYYFCEPDIPRAMKAEDLFRAAQNAGLKGEVIPDVNKAIAKARSIASPDDLIFIGGSTFVVAGINEL